MISSPCLRAATIVLSLAFVASALAFGLLFANFTADDAFITFRYARNLVAYGQWSWNPGHALQDVEAYTNPLFAALSIPFHLLGLPPTVPFKLLGLAALAFIFRSTLQGLTPARKAVAAAFVCANFYVFPHAFSGLETDVFLLAALLVLNADERDLGNVGFTSLILLAPLIRPEGALISAYILYTQVRLRQVNPWAGLFIALGAAYMAWRVNRYGQWLPNTYYAKVHQGASFMDNVHAERHVLALGLLSWWALRVTGRSLVLPTLLLLAFVFGNLRADMQMNYLHRFSYHLVVPVALHAARALLLQINWPLPLKPWGGPHKVAVLAGLFTLSLATLSLHQSFAMLDYYPSALATHKELARALKRDVPSSTVVAVEDAGLIPYYSGLTIIDYVGLASREISGYLRDGTSPVLPAPDVILLYTASAQSCEPVTRFRGIQALMRDAMKQDRYACVQGIRWSATLFMNALVRKDSAQAASLTRVITRRAIDTPRLDKDRKAILVDALRFRALREDLRN